MMDKSFENKVALVTGAAQGIGFACAETLGLAGACVLLADSNEVGVEEAEKKLIEKNIKVKAVACDVRFRNQIEGAVEMACSAFGSLDFVVANAGIVRAADFLQFSEKDWDDVIDTNLKGVFLTGQVAAKKMVSQGRGGSIVNLSSVNGITAIPTICAYNASKGGINNLTRAMALSLTRHNIRVNAVAPGSIMTEMLQKVAGDPKVMQGVLSRTPMLRAGKPEEVANVVKFLLSSDSSYMTGQILYVDGGRMALNYTVEVPNDILEEATGMAA